jgi:excisionase family DNA binding protein
MGKLSFEEFKSDQLLSIQEVAELLRINETTARELIRSGELLAFRVGHRSRIQWSEIAAYLNRHQAIDIPVREVK